MTSRYTHPKVLSFEFYPPKTDDGAASLKVVHDKLARLNPGFFSVTFGAGGSTREKTFETVVAIQSKGIAAAPHLSCVASTKDNIRTILLRFLKKLLNQIPFFINLPTEPIIARAAFRNGLYDRFPRLLTCHHFKNNKFCFSQANIFYCHFRTSFPKYFPCLIYFAFIPVFYFQFALHNVARSWSFMRM
jgi:hypothetical protein